MSILVQVIAGQRPVLHNCWIEGAGTDGFGRDAAQMLIGGLTLDELGHSLSAPGSALLVGKSGDAVFADIINGEVKRLWLLARTAPGPRGAERTDQPFDTDLDQRGGSVAFDPVDHPDLAAEHAERIQSAAANWLRASGPQGLNVLRPFVLRAFSDGANAVALIAVYGTRTDAPGLARFNVAVVVSDSGEPVTVVDQAGLDDAIARKWSPRF